jgi:predicted nucleic acid-binding Zn ribbon protein
MPIYPYECSACLRIVERTCRSWDEDDWRVGAPICDFCREGRMERRITAPMLHFKGSGWTPKHYLQVGDLPPSEEVDAFRKERGGQTK